MESSDKRIRDLFGKHKPIRVAAFDQINYNVIILNEFGFIQSFGNNSLPVPVARHFSVDVVNPKLVNIFESSGQSNDEVEKKFYMALIGRESLFNPNPNRITELDSNYNIIGEKSQIDEELAGQIRKNKFGIRFYDEKLKLTKICGSYYERTDTLVTKDKVLGFCLTPVMFEKIKYNLLPLKCIEVTVIQSTSEENRRSGIDRTEQFPILVSAVNAEAIEIGLFDGTLKQFKDFERVEDNSYDLYIELLIEFLKILISTHERFGFNSVLMRQMAPQNVTSEVDQELVWRLKIKVPFVDTDSGLGKSRRNIESGHGSSSRGMGSGHSSSSRGVGSGQSSSSRGVGSGHGSSRSVDKNVSWIGYILAKLLGADYKEFLSCDSREKSEKKEQLFQLIADMTAIEMGRSNCPPIEEVKERLENIQYR